ncbi:hypothetical protein [Armatimonas sp.]|uniref:hypothetical protein n=1 Tax=Armatimonas sp. TaxID=1872638 RepID=UPI00286C3B1F|nr:hypothetical protein [Armatimonas sp.]
MSRTSEPYKASFSEGEKVRIASLGMLIQFQRDWQAHHAVTEAQFPYANQEAVVRRVSFYHMGTVLYELEDIPGFWHEPCLVASG